jgi:very-short-patch-repair endonuclease
VDGRARRLPFGVSLVRMRPDRALERLGGVARTESVLRAIAIDVPGLRVEPQVWVDDIGSPDLLDRGRRLVIEADSFEFHGRRRALTRDCERYKAFALSGWVVVRFSWEHVMFQPAYVHDVLAAVVDARPLGRALRPQQAARPA